MILYMGLKCNSNMPEVTYTNEELADFKTQLAEYLVEKDQIYQENCRSYPYESVTDVDKHLTKIKKSRVVDKRVCFLHDEVDRLTNILLEHLEEYQSPTTPGL